MTKAFYYTGVVNVCNKTYSIQDSRVLELAEPIKIQGQRNVSNEFQVEQDENFLGGSSLLRGKGTVVDESGWENVLYRNQEPSSKSIDIMAILYYAGENRAADEMRVWLRSRVG